MANLAQFKTTKALSEGTWVNLGDEFDDLEIKSRGFTTAYNDARDERLRRVARQRYGGDLMKIPSHEVRDILSDLMIKHTLQDVRNLFDQEGKPVSFDLFCQLIKEDDFSDLYNAALRAAQLVTAMREADDAEKKTNSSKPSK